MPKFWKSVKMLNVKSINTLVTLTFVYCIIYIQHNVFFINYYYGIFLFPKQINLFFNVFGSIHIRK